MKKLIASLMLATTVLSGCVTVGQALGVAAVVGWTAVELATPDDPPDVVHTGIVKEVFCISESCTVWFEDGESYTIPLKDGELALIIPSGTAARVVRKDGYLSID